MNTIRLVSSLFLCGIVFLMNTSFTGSERYTPILMKRSDLIHSVGFTTEAPDLVRPGKIYYKAPYIFVNERYKGVHVIDNTNPASPRTIGFIRVPGCLDMAVKGDILYVDNSTDLVAFNLSTREVVHRIESVFPEPAYPTNSSFRVKDKPEDMVVVEWKPL